MRLRGLLVLVAATAVLVSGCGGSPSPKPMPKPSGSTTASSSPSPPEMPAVAKGVSEKAVAAFARHYVAAFNYASVTGHTHPLDALSAAECKACNRLIQQIHSVYAEGGSIETTGWTVRKVDVVAHQPDTRQYVDLLVDQPAQKVRRAADARVQTFPGGRQPITMLLSRSADAWVVTDLRIVA